MIGLWGSEAFRVVLRGYALQRDVLLTRVEAKRVKFNFFEFLATTARKKLSLFSSALERDAKEENSGWVFHFENRMRVAWYCLNGKIPEVSDIISLTCVLCPSQSLI